MVSVKDANWDGLCLVIHDAVGIWTLSPMNTKQGHRTQTRNNASYDYRPLGCDTILHLFLLNHVNILFATTSVARLFCISRNIRGDCLSLVQANNIHPYFISNYLLTPYASFKSYVTLKYAQTFVLPTNDPILYSLYSLLHVSALNLGHSQWASSLFDVHTVDVHVIQGAHPLCAQVVSKSWSSDLIYLKIMLDLQMFGHSLLYFNNYFKLILILYLFINLQYFLTP